MTHHASNADRSVFQNRGNAVLQRSIRAMLAGGACAFASLFPAESWADYQVIRRYDERGETKIVRRIKPLNFAISTVPDGEAPPNDCPGLAFEIQNPRYGEKPCIGYLLSTKRRH